MAGGVSAGGFSAGGVSAGRAISVTSSTSMTRLTSGAGKAVCSGAAVVGCRRSRFFTGASLAITTASHGTTTMPSAHRVSHRPISGGRAETRIAAAMMQTTRTDIMST